MNKKKRKIKKKNLAIFLLVSVIIFLVILFNQSGKNFDNGVSFDGASEDYKCPDCNVILITIDALRPDHLGCYGYERNTSPNIDKLAKEGVLFTQAISQSSFTNPALPSLMTSMYPDVHGVRGWGDYINPLILTWAQFLNNNGFYTGAICAEDFFVAILGLEGGFDTLSKGIDLTAENITREAVLWLEKNKDKKFFLWLHYFDPHEPYRPPTHIKIEPENVRFKDDDKQVPILNERPSDPDIYGGLGGIAEYAVVEGMRDKGYYILLYDKEIKYVDEQIGILLKNLEELGLDKNTLIIITADHGEALGEHNLYFTHGMFLYDELLKVPLIMVGGFLPKNEIIKAQVESIDILPTIMDILRINYNKRGIEGISLLPTLYSKNKNDKYGESYAFSEFEDKKSIRSPEWKLIYTSNSEEYELYNLKEDPQELNNLADIEKDQFKLMKEKLEEWVSREKENISSLTKPLDEETKEKLRSLGYLQ